MFSDLAKRVFPEAENGAEGNNLRQGTHHEREHPHPTVAAHPDVNLQLKIKPVDFQIGGEAASLSLATGDIHLRVEEIPHSHSRSRS